MRYLFLLLFLSAFGCHKSGSSNQIATGKLGITMDCDVLIIQVDAKTSLQPDNLKDFPDVTKKVGQQVWFSYTIVPDRISMCISGPVIHLKSIKNY